MNRWIYLILFAIIFSNVNSQEKWRGNTTPTYSELNTHLKNISSLHNEVELYNMGPSDYGCLLYTSPSPRDRQKSRMPSSA